MNRTKPRILSCLIIFFSTAAYAQQLPPDTLQTMGTGGGICTILEDEDAAKAIQLAGKSKYLFYVQMSNQAKADAARKAACKAGFLGTRIFVGEGPLSKIQLADNITDFLVSSKASPQGEILRVLRPGGRAYVAGKAILKPFPKGMDDWRHPDHGPDNNPVSKDQVARAPYLTQFMSWPMHAPLPQVTVASAGRVFKLYGHFAPHEREEHLLNSLVAVNGCNGSILWKEKLDPDFRVLGSNVIATPDVFYMAHHTLRLRDPATGRVIREIKVPERIKGQGPRPKPQEWKWIALEDGHLLALFGDTGKTNAPPIRTRYGGYGWSWGFVRTLSWTLETGCTFAAMDPKNHAIQWQYTSDKRIDARGISAGYGRVYLPQPKESRVICLDAKTGKEIWNVTHEVLNILKHPNTLRGFKWGIESHTKCSSKAFYHPNIVLSAKDGSVLWKPEKQIFLRQSLLRDGVLYVANKRFDLLTGKNLGHGPPSGTGLLTCSRLTGSIDTIFGRFGQHPNGTLCYDLAGKGDRVFWDKRPTCNDGVITSDGLLYWWPMVCDCNHSLSGTLCMGSAGSYAFDVKASDKTNLEVFSRTASSAAEARPNDWPAYKGGNSRSCANDVTVGTKTRNLWTFIPDSEREWTAPVVVGETLFLGGTDGRIVTLNAETGKTNWHAFTGSSIRFPPAFWQGRLFASSTDGWVYAFDAVNGKRLWRFRAAPLDQRIPVFGKLISRWPVSGVLVEGGTVYAAAGITANDGTQVYALDAATGKLKWQNNLAGGFSARTSDKARMRVKRKPGVRGSLTYWEGKLYMPSGQAGVVAFDAATGKGPEHVRLTPSSEVSIVDSQPFGFGPVFYRLRGYWDFPMRYKDMVLATRGRCTIMADRMPKFKNLIHATGSIRRGATPPDKRLICLDCTSKDLAMLMKKNQSRYMRRGGESLVGRRDGRLKSFLKWRKDIKDCRAIALAKNAVLAVIDGGIFYEDPADKVVIDKAWRTLAKDRAEDLPAGFANLKFNDSKWETLDMKEASYNWKGDIHLYPFKQKFAVYRRRFTVPAEWKGRQVRIHFGDTSIEKGRILVQINGQEVENADFNKIRKKGYALDFNITVHVRYGRENVVAVRLEHNGRRKTGLLGPAYIKAVEVKAKTAEQKPPSELMAFDIKTGKELWTHPLPEKPIRNGIGIDRKGNIIVVLWNGKVLCFGLK